MATDIERLSVLIEANTKSYERSMLKLQQQTDKAIRGASKSIEHLGGTLETVTLAAETFSKALGVGFIFGGLVELPHIIEETVKSVAELSHQAEKLGVTSDALQELQFAARQVGIGTEELDTALTRFGKNLGQAAAGGGELFKVLKANGVALEDANGKFLPFTVLLEKYFDLIKNARSDQDRLNLSVIGFGKGATNIANLARDGAAGLNELMQQARDAGAVINKDLVESARLLEERLQRLKDQFDVLIKTQILEFLQRLSDTMAVLQNTSAFVADKFETLASAAGFLSDVKLPDWLQVVKQSAENIIDPIGTATKAIDTLTKAAKEAFPLSPNARIDQAFNDAATLGIPRITIHGQPTNRPPPSKTGGKTPAEKFADDIKAIKARTAALDADTASVGLSVLAAQKLQAVQDLLNQAIKAGVEVTPALRAEIEKNATAYAEAAARLDEAKKQFEAINDLGRAFGEGLASSIEGLTDHTKTLNDVLLDVAKAIQDAALQALLLGQGPLGQLLGLAGSGGGIGGILGGILGAFGGGAAPALSSPSIPSISRGIGGPNVVQLHVVRGEMFEPVVTAISGAVVVKHTSGIEARAIARAPVVARDNQRRFG